MTTGSVGYVRGAGSGSVLRVDSKRIDQLLNLVSEAVINKATFNQLNSQFDESISDIQNVHEMYKEKFKEFFDTLPDYLDELRTAEANRDTVKILKSEFSDKFLEVLNRIDRTGSQLKETATQLHNSSQILGRITSELQEAVMRIRMVPISFIFSRFPRLVRDLSKNLNKKIKLVVEGEGAELDKSVIEDLLDPLIHCVRNSIDHGIEPPDIREKIGKPPEGRLLLKAYNEGNMIVIQIADDGKGIDIDSIIKQAGERGIIHPEKKLTELEAFNLIFGAGFSTAEKITNISGRGVGLDVVRTQVEKLNGSVSVWSEPGKGTAFTIKLPLTLAIIPGLLVRVGKEIYVIPISSVIESYRIKTNEIMTIDNHEVFNLRDDVLSLFRLNRLFSIGKEEEREHCYIVIVGRGEQKIGLLVDALIGEEDVVIKPLRDKYTNVPGIAGANILGDGMVSLILDVNQLLELGLEKGMAERKQREAAFSGKLL